MNKIRKSVRALVSKYDTCEPFLLCDYCGIITQSIPLPEGTYGLYLKAYGLQFVFISRILNGALSRVVCAHELGHAILHPDTNSLYLTEKTLFSKGRLEAEADIFAAELLISDEDITDRFYECETAEGLAHRLSVPEKYVELKKKSLES